MTQRDTRFQSSTITFVLLLAAVAAACTPDHRPSIQISPAPPETTTTTGELEGGGSDATVHAASMGHPLPLFWADSPSLIERSASPPSNAALAAIVMDEASGTILYEKDAHRQLQPASLTKIATAILAAENGRLDEPFTIDVDSRTMRGSTVMGLISGDHFTMRDLLHGLMMPSGNDAALAIGRAVAGSDAAFVQQMNDLSRRLGLTDTNWANPHGLNGLDHRTSAYDLAILSRYYMSFPDLRDVVSKPSYTARGDRAIQMWTLNPLFGYPGVDGLKTGYTRSAGNTLVTSRVMDGHRIFVVILNDGNRAGDAWALAQWANVAYRWPDSAAAPR
ncbi:MAG: D-alanyl-D-alanine carboxypeptidase [Dehalococcoidia bacterium]|nr:D-alanyl-D-alanine carboxypeptidase [Dehalococcoidia bacterium]